MLLWLQPYDLEIRYQPGKEITVADALSRLLPEEIHPVEDMNVQIHDIAPCFADNMVRQIEEETTRDPKLVMLKEVIHAGWPTTVKELPDLPKPYWNYRDELFFNDGILLKGSRIIIPQVLQEGILSKLHAAHKGVEKMKLRARATVFGKEIEEVTKKCRSCQELACKQTKEPDPYSCPTTSLAYSGYRFVSF